MSKTFVNFIQTARISDKAVTHSWLVFPKRAATPIGTVKWHAPWRRYCYFPEANSLYDGACLQEIAFFCADKTIKRKEERRRERALALGCDF